MTARQRPMSNLSVAPESQNAFDDAERFRVRPHESPLLAMAQRDLVHAVLGFVMAPLRDRNGPRHEPIDAFESALEARFAKAMAGAGVVQDAALAAKLQGRRAWDDFVTLAWRGYVNSHLEAARSLSLVPHVPLLSNELSDDCAYLVVVERGGIPLSKADGFDESKGLILEHLWLIACNRLERANARVASLVVLRGMNDFAVSRDGWGETAIVQYERLYTQVCSLRQQAKLEAFSVGALLGERAWPILKEMARSTYGCNRSVMQLTNVDGVLPGNGWPTAEEQAVRDAIAQA